MTALERYNRNMEGELEPDPIERLIFFLSLALTGQDWIDVEQFIDGVSQQLDTAWAQAHRLALELECLLMDTKDNAIVSKWWDSAHEAMDEYHKLKPSAAEDSEAWASLRKAVI